MLRTIPRLIVSYDAESIRVRFSTEISSAIISPSRVTKTYIRRPNKFYTLSWTYVQRAGLLVCLSVAQKNHCMKMTEEEKWTIYRQFALFFCCAVHEFWKL